MCRNLLSILILCLLPLTCKLFAEEQLLTNERLEEGTWELRQGNGGGSLVFKAGYFRFHYADEGIPGADVSGTYTISGDSVGLKPIVIETNGSGAVSHNLPEDLKHIRDIEMASPCKLASPLNSPEFHDALFCPFLTFWDIKTVLKSGMERLIDNVPSVSTGRKQVRVKTPVCVRSRPDVTAVPIKCDWSMDGSPEGILNPNAKMYANYRIDILARTREKSTIKSWTNYWYNVEIQTHALGWCSANGWVFGEYISIIDLTLS